MNQFNEILNNQNLRKQNILKGIERGDEVEVENDDKERLELIQEKNRLIGYRWDGYNLSDEEKQEIKDINKKLSKTRKTLEHGETYSIEDFIEGIPSYTGKNKNPEKKFFEENFIYGDEAKSKASMLKEIVNGNQSIYKYFNESYNPTDIKMEALSEDKEDVKSNNIYDKMAAKTITHFKASFKIKLGYNQEPITVVKEFSKNTTLSMRDINSFM